MQRLNRIRLLQGAATAFASVALLAPATATAAPASSPAPTTLTVTVSPAVTWAASWECTGKTYADHEHDGEQTFIVQCGKVASQTFVAVHFDSYGEVIRIYDYFDNDRKTFAKVYVERSGTATWYGDGQERVINESFSEGKSVGLEVCTSDSPNAVCSRMYFEEDFT
jgi:hypothetical protein